MHEYAWESLLDNILQHVREAPFSALPPQKFLAEYSRVIFETRGAVQFLTSKTPQRN